MNEFECIRVHLAPLAAREKGALQLSDDAAIITVPQGQELIITKDAIVEGVHFTGDEAPDLIARKLLRVNLSDLAAMGATPHGYFLALMLPAAVDEAWLQTFAEGLKTDQNTFAISLMGGDTTRTQGPLSFSVTALGFVPAGRALLRSGARPGDYIYVSGTIGDGALGLKVAQGALSLPLPASNALLERYRLPQPRVALGQALRGFASACIDISDGLVQDLGHICETSHVGAEIHLQNIPLSDAAQAALPLMEKPFEAVLAGGDDYELLFTASPESAEKIEEIAGKTNTPVTRIGQISECSGVRVLDAAGKEVVLPSKGYTHF